MRREAVAGAAVLAAAALFSTTGTSKELLAPDAPATAVAAWRLAIGAAGLIALALWRGGSMRTLVGLWRLPLVWVMGVFVVGYQVFFFIGTQRTGVAIGTLVALGLAPVLAGLLGWAEREGAPGWLWAGSTLVALIGLGLLTTGGEGELNVLGVLAAATAAASYAVYTVFGARLARSGHDSTSVLAAAFTIGAVITLPLLLTGGDWWATPNGLLLVLWLGLGTTSVGYALFGVGLRYLQPGHIATITLAEPALATMLGVIVLGEHLTGTGWLGTVLILTALAVLGIGETRGRRARESESIAA